MTKHSEEIYHIARLALTGRRQDIQSYLQRLSRTYRQADPDLANRINALLSEVPTNESPLRGVSSSAANAIPVDGDSRLQLVRIEDPVTLETDPIWTSTLSAQLNQVVNERLQARDLANAGMHPTKSLLFTGPPGVGKSLGARWIASQLKRPLLTLDLSAVMSSFLGKTGVNVKYVLEYAKGLNCVLFLDELDAIAKRRDDATEIGELKRLVTVLLQEIDDWPDSGVLVAATNHPDLLDPAVWRRFEMVLTFPMPSDEQVHQVICAFLKLHNLEPALAPLLSILYRGMSFSDVDREMRSLYRQAVINKLPMTEVVTRTSNALFSTLPTRQKKPIAMSLLELGYSQHEVHRITGVSRPTLRKERNKVDEKPAGG